MPLLLLMCLLFVPSVSWAAGSRTLGAGDYLDAGTAANTAASTPFTVAVMVKLDTDPGAVRALIARITAAATNGWQLNITNTTGTIAFVNNENSTATGTGATAVAVGGGVWYGIAAVVTGSGGTAVAHLVRFRPDTGVLASENVTLFYSPSPSGTQKLTIGGRWTGAINQNATGSYHRAGVWSGVALTDTQLTDWFCNGTAAAGADALWNIDGLASPETDGSGNAYDATVVGTTSGSAVPACTSGGGGSTGNPSAFPLLTDLNVRPEPALPAMGPVGSKIVDPTFGTTILRATDATSITTGGAEVGYSYYPTFNVNSTRMVVNSGGAIWFIPFNPSTFTVGTPTRLTAAPPAGTLSDVWDVIWSGTNPDLIYIHNRANLLMSYNVATAAWATVKDFSAVLPGNRWLDQQYKSIDDNIFAILTSSVQFSTVAGGYIIWRKSDDTVLANVSDGQWTELALDKNGQYFARVSDTPVVEYYAVADLVHPIFTLSGLGSGGFFHHDEGVNGLFSAYHPTNGYAYRTMSNPSVLTTLLNGLLGDDQQEHDSMLANGDQYAVVGHAIKNGGTVTAFKMQEIIQVNVTTGAVRRIAHHRLVNSGNYAPKANISRDGQFIAFNSNWGNTAGRHDVYVVRVPTQAADTVPPTQVTGVSVSPSATQNAVTWSAAVDGVGVTGYTVRQCIGNACTPVTGIATVSGTTLAYLNTGLTPGTIYGYTVQAFDAANNQGPQSAITYATTPTTYKTIQGTDSFTRANNTDIGTGYDPGYIAQTNLQLVSNRVRSVTVNTRSYETYNTTTPGTDQWGQVTVTSLNGAVIGEVGVQLRASNATTVTSYSCIARINGATAEITRFATGTPNVLVSSSTVTWGTGDKLRCEAEGTTLRLYRVVGQIATLVLSTTDATLASGKVGLSAFVATNGVLTDVELDDFAMGSFAGSPDAPPTITSVNAGNTSATLTFGVTPISVRVETATASVVEPIASFPGGAYTYPAQILNTLTTSICFYPRDGIGTEFTRQCGAVTPPADVTPPVVSNATPSTDLPVGSTTGVISVTTNEAAECRYATSDIAYSGMTLPMDGASLTYSATVTGLTNGSSTVSYVRCSDLAGNANSSSTVITVHVANSTADTTAPTDVTNLSAIALSASQAELAWTASTDAGGIAGYQVYLCAGLFCSNFALAGQPVGTTTTVVNLIGSTFYSFVVRAIDTSNNLSISPSNVATISTSGIIDVTPPSSLTTITAIAYTRSVNLFWTAATDNSNTVFYIIERCTGAACSDYGVVGTTLVIPYLDRLLTPATTYRYRVKASDLSGNVSAAYSTVTNSTTGNSGLTQPRRRRQ